MVKIWFWYLLHQNLRWCPVCKIYFTSWGSSYIFLIRFLNIRVCSDKTWHDYFFFFKSTIFFYIGKHRFQCNKIDILRMFFIKHFQLHFWSDTRTGFMKMCQQISLPWQLWFMETSSAADKSINFIELFSINHMLRKLVWVRLFICR